MQLPRVLLLEDDPAVRLFVQMALEPLALEVVPCSTLAEARQALADCDIRLVFTDLRLPDGSGLDLLQWLQDRARSTGVACRIVVFSGGIDPAMECRLQALQVWRVLRKPASVASLIACVSDALAADTQAGPAVAEPPGPDPVADFFGGNRPLYDAYRSACLAQFPKDLNAGDIAVRVGDAQALRRVAHNLTSVLAILGSEPAALVARQTEDAAEKGDMAQMRSNWLLLREHLLQLKFTTDPREVLHPLRWTACVLASKASGLAAGE